ncbi:unnamed protein product [Caenorhabditis sp. 36 PRJEB53466]|nr:unnamed protein product [Caenorhabditis sp. 36 PRJEB53466]
MRLISSCFLVALFSNSWAAPTCEANSFCYYPDDFTKITVTRAGNFVNLKIWDEKSTVGTVNFVQKSGKEIAVNCGEGSSTVSKKDGITSCVAQLSVDQFDKNLPVSIKLADSRTSDSFSVDSLLPPLQEGLTKDQRRQFSKAHAILMIIGWLFFVPSGFLFARLGRDLFTEHKLFGNAIWFQVHRAANFMGVVCICASMLCIFISQQWTWKGTGSGSKYWTEVHTDLGVISAVLAVAQPINSLFRCGPTHSRRIIFNWAHRCVGIASFSLALTAIIIAALQFKRIWNEPLLELVLSCLPIVICLVATIAFSVIESDRFRGKSSYGAHVLKAPLFLVDRSLLLHRHPPFLHFRRRLLHLRLHVLHILFHELDLEGNGIECLRSVFNWAHRVVGIVSYTFAVAAIYVAAANYRKTWSEPVMEIALASVPTIFCLGTGLMLPYLERKRRNDEYKAVEMNEKSVTPSPPEDPHLVRTAWMFLVIGTCFGAATSLSLLVANGFKSG